MKINSAEIYKKSNFSKNTLFKIEGTVTKQEWHRMMTSGIKLEELEKKAFDYRKLNDITDVVAQYFRLDRASMFESSRCGKFADARALCFYFFDKYDQSGFTYTQYAEFFGQTSHANVLHHLKNVRNEMKVNRAYKFDVEQIDSLINKYKIV